MIKYIIPISKILSYDRNTTLYKDVIYTVNEVTYKQILGKHWIAVNVNNFIVWVYNDSKIIKLDEVGLRKYKIEKLRKLC